MTQKYNNSIPPKVGYLPERIERLNDLAYNLWWSWNPDAVEVFQKINPVLWEKVSHNPVAFLQQVAHPLLDQAANDQQYLALYDQVTTSFDAYVNQKSTWFTEKYPDLTEQQIAYFSFEFGLHESIPAYAGGLGILAGDHLKEASDMGLPLAAIGFIYTQGYFVQKITEDGWQETSNFYLDFNKLPMIPLTDEKGNPLLISVPLPGREIKARIWKIQVGRVDRKSVV